MGDKSLGGIMEQELLNIFKKIRKEIKEEKKSKPFSIGQLENLEMSIWTVDVFIKSLRKIIKKDLKS